MVLSGGGSFGAFHMGVVKALAVGGWVVVGGGSGWWW